MLPRRLAGGKIEVVHLPLPILTARTMGMCRSPGMTEQELLLPDNLNTAPAQCVRRNRCGAAPGFPFLGERGKKAFAGNPHQCLHRKAIKVTWKHSFRADLGTAS